MTSYFRDCETGNSTERPRPPSSKRDIRPNRSNTISGFALLISLPSEGQSLWAKKNSSTYLNWWLRYNYCRFWKTNVRHIGNLLSVSISTICQKSAYYSASGYWILSKSKHPLRKYDVISISQNGGRDDWILLLVSYLLMSLPSEGQSLLANQILSRYLKWRLRYFYGNSKWLGKGSICFQNQECVNILGCSVTFYEYKNVFLMLVDNVAQSGLICNESHCTNNRSWQTRSIKRPRCDSKVSCFLLL